MKTNPSQPNPIRTRPSALLAVSVCSALMISAPLAFAQVSDPYPREDPMPEARERGDSIARGDRAFLEDASEASLKAVVVGETVLQRLSDPSVLAFAQQVVADQGRLRQDVRTLATRKGVTLPTEDPTDDVQEWSTKSKGVDKDYLDAVIDNHEDTIDLFEEAVDSKDAEISSYAQRTVIGLKQQLEQAKVVRKTHAN